MHSIYLKLFISPKWVVISRLLLLFMAIYTNSSAQVLGLKAALHKTMDNYPLLLQHQNLLQKAKRHEKTVANFALPNLIIQDQQDLGTVNSLSGSYYTYGMVPSVSGGNTAENGSNINLGNISIAYLQWDFFNFGYMRSLKSEAEKQSTVADANLEEVQYLITQDIIFLYIDWLKKYLLVNIETENVQNATLVYTAIKANVRSGLKPGVDSSTSAALLSGAKIAYLQALNEFEKDSISLALYTNIKTGYIVPDTGILDIIPIQVLITHPVVDSLPANHPLLNVVKNEYELQLGSLDVISKKYMPHFGLSGAFWDRSTGISPKGTFTSGIENGFGMPYTRYNYLIGLTATYNIFDIKHRRDYLEEGKLQAAAIKNVYNTKYQQLQGALLQVNASYTIALEKLKELPIQITAAAQAYHQQLALYKAGLNTLPDVINAQYVWEQAQKDHLIAQCDLLRLLYSKAALTGNPNLFLQNLKQ